MEKIRVLCIMDSLSVNSGVSSVVMNIYRQLYERNIVFDFVLHNKCDVSYEHEVLDMGSDIYYMPPIKNLFKFLIQVNKLLKENKKKYRIIHLHAPTYSIFYYIIAKYYCIPNRVIHSHSSKGANTKIKELRNYVLNKWATVFANNFIACSENAAEYLYGKKMINRNIAKIIYNGINPIQYRFNFDVREKFRNELKIKDDVVYTHIGRFSYVKNHRFILEIFNEILKINSKSTLLLVGEGELKTQIVNYAKELGILNRIHFLGVRNDIENILNASDAIIMPSFFEGLPMVGLEAQCNGTSIFLSDNITKEICITDLCKYISLDRSAKEWADIITSTKFSNEHRGNYINYINQSMFDIEIIATQLEEFYKQIYISK